MQRFLPHSAFEILLPIIISAVNNKSMRFVITSFVLTLWTTSRGVSALIRSINNAYKIKETRGYFKILGLSMIFIVTILLILYTTLIFLVYGEKIGYFVFDIINLDNIFIDIWNTVRYIIGICIIILGITSLYKYAPNKYIKMSQCIPGAIISTILWISTSFLYSFYANNYATYEVIYGSLAGIIALMTWIYLSSWSIIIGSYINANITFISEDYNTLRNK